MSDQQSELRRAADAWKRARETERKKMSELTIQIVRAARSMSEAEIVRATGINRVTVRKAMGKDHHSSPSTPDEPHPDSFTPTIDEPAFQTR